VATGETVPVPLPAYILRLGWPQWSRDGAWITFWGHTEAHPVYNAQIYVARPDGSECANVVDGSDDNVSPSFSPDGTQIVFHRVYDGPSRVNRDGTGLTYFGLDCLGHTRWSPVDNRVTVTNWGCTYESDIYVFDMDTGATTQITHHEPSTYFNYADWSPDGTKILAAGGPTGSNSDIFLMNADGAGLVNLTADWNDSNEWYPSWSPDGQFIVFMSDRSGGPWTSDIWAMHPDGTGRVNLTNTPDVNESVPAVTGDWSTSAIPVLKISPARTSACTQVAVRVLLTNSCAVEGLSFGVSHDPEVLKALSCVATAVSAGLNGGAGPEFWAASLGAQAEDCDAAEAGITLGMVGSLISPADSTIAPGVNQEVATITYEPVPRAKNGVETLLEFVDCLKANENTEVAKCVVTCNSASRKPLKVPGRVLMEGCFKRGDCNCDGEFDISDPITILKWLFVSNTQPCCMEACDANDDGELDMSDGIAKLTRLFIGAPPLAEPFKSCGPDPTGDALGCDEFPPCQ